MHFGNALGMHFAFEVDGVTGGNTTLPESQTGINKVKKGRKPARTRIVTDAPEKEELKQIKLSKIGNKSIKLKLIETPDKKGKRGMKKTL